MRVLERRTYVGPNLYAHFRVIRWTIDLGPLEDHPSGTIPGFVDQLVQILPGLLEHGCSYGEHGGFRRRMTEEGGTWMGHVLEHVAIELQNLAGTPVTFGKTRSGDLPKGQYHVVFEYADPWVGEQAGDLALRLLHHILPKALVPDAEIDPGFDVKQEIEALIRGAQKRAFGPSTSSLVKAAEARGVPWIRIGDASLVQFGYGEYQQRIQATITSQTKHISVEIASDKELTNKILADIGLPVPRQTACYTYVEAKTAAKRLRWPLVVKPLNANHGRGVTIGVRDDAGLEVAWDQARLHSRCVLLEQYIEGFDHRILVVNGEVVAVSMRVPGHVVGDGKHTIRELVEIVNQDPRRGIGHEKVLTRLELDHQALLLIEKGGHTAETVLPAGEVFYLRSTGNLSTGGTAIDRTDQCHLDNKEMAIRATAAVGLDVCGVDFLTPDISRSYKESGGAICEVNAAPGFRMHVAPSEGHPRDVASKVIEMLFPPGTPSRIPIAAITGTNGKTTTTRMLSHIHKIAGKTVGMTTTDGTYIDGRRTMEGDLTGPSGAQMILRDPTISVAVLETARGGLIKRGLGYDAPDVACCLNVSSDHLGLNGIDTLEQLAEVKRIIIEVARDCVVLNADDPLVVRMAGHSRAKSICYVTADPANVLVREHIRAGGRAVALEPGMNGDMISLYERGAHIPLLWTHLIPATVEGKARHNVQNAMFSAAMAWAMGVKLDDIRHGLRTFDTTFFQAPGRTNIYDAHGFKVILDYGHNVAAMDAMCDFVERLHERKPGVTKRIVVLAAPGDRRDQDVRAICAIVAGKFDHYICRGDDDPRGRASDEVPKMIAAELQRNGVRADQVQVQVSEQDAVEAGLKLCGPGDLLLVFADKVTRSWKQIIYYGGKPREAEAKAPVHQVYGPVAEEPSGSEPVWLGKAVVTDSRGAVLADDPSTEQAD
jgi:cyanophycin synthetase